jgi:hypothetical protein
VFSLAEPQHDPVLGAIPPPTVIRQQLAVLTHRTCLLRALLRVAERKERAEVNNSREAPRAS